jgi:segregation and condensation protein B
MPEDAPEIPTWTHDVGEPLPEPPPAPAEPPATPASAPVAPPEEPAAPPPMLRLIEAMLFIGGAPLTAVRACEAVRGLTAEVFVELIDQLNRDYRAQGRPYRIQPADQGYELVLRPRYRGVQQALYGSVREARLSPAALDTLALVAYRQPVTKQEVDSLRGGESGSLLRQLVRLGLVALSPNPANAREVVYNTTPRFLSLFQLTSLDDLPRTQDLQRI